MSIYFTRLPQESKKYSAGTEVDFCYASNKKSIFYEHNQIYKYSFFVVIINLSANAQHISLGPSVGAGISMVSNNEEGVDVSPQFLWNGGVIFVYSTKTHFGFGADLKYSAEGYQAKIAGLSENIHVHLNYLRIPVRIIYFFGEYGDHMRPKIFLGLTPGLLLSAKSEDTDIKDAFNSFDLGARGGVGINIRLASAVWLNTDVSYYQGFLDLGISKNSILNSHLVLSAGVAFGIGGK
ncbi:MAG TPA: porin family protein [Chitinophagales bacterium]|nr:porin family protein [Chitinophagales bacterium]